MTEQHRLGYVVGDTVRVFTRTGFSTGVAEHITKTGRLNVRYSNGALRQFNAAGRELGNGATTDWGTPPFILPKAEQEERAEDIRVESRRRKQREAFKERLRDLGAKDPIHERDAIADDLRTLLDDVLQGTLK